LTLQAKRESFSSSAFTSGKIVTRKKRLFQFGRIDIRAQMPAGQGMWPALWMLGDNQDVVGWPSCGEIDMVEVIGGSGRENEALGTAFWDNNGVANFTGKYKLPSGTFADEYHVFSIIWDDNFIRWYVDDQLYNTLDISSQSLSELRAPFYMIFNVAVGGNLPGSPNATTIFPAEMKVDYVRYFQDK
jgi:beta-glucanase (GH16 family)